MPRTTPPRKRNTRPRVEPPMVGLAHFRTAAGYTLDALSARIANATGRTYTAGALNAVERGLRGASHELLRDLEAAYGLPAGAVTTSYLPRRRRADVEDAA